MSIIFQWSQEDLLALAGSCVLDDATPVIERHFKPGDRLLEAGCGAGRWLRYFKDKGYPIVGLEYSAETVAMVRRTWPDLEVVQGDCEDSPFPEASFDGALSFGVVEHWTEGPQKPLADLLRVLKPGAKAYISVPCFNTVRRVKRALWWNEVFGIPRALYNKLRRGGSLRLTRFDRSYLFPVNPAWGDFFEYHMSPQDFRREVEKAGFEVLEHVAVANLDGIYHELNPLRLLLRWKDWRFRPTALALYLDRWLRRYPFAHPHMQSIVARKPVAA